MQMISRKENYQWIKHAFGAVSPNEIRSFDCLRGFFAVQLPDQFGQHVVIVLFKRYEFGAQLDGAPILFKVTT